MQTQDRYWKSGESSGSPLNGHEEVSGGWAGPCFICQTKGKQYTVALPYMNPIQMTFPPRNDPLNLHLHSCSQIRRLFFQQRLLHVGSDNRSRPGQKLSTKKKEKWLRDLIKSSLVDSDAWWRAHYEAWSFPNDTTVSPPLHAQEKKRKKKTWLGWQALSDTANLLITWKLEGAHAKKEINLAGVHLAQIAKLWICFQIMSLPACQLTCHFL